MPEELPRDHFVSRGYQQNFATDDKRVSVFNVGLGRVVDPLRPIKSNYREQGFTTFLDVGVPNDLLERAFASVEKRVLNEIRRVNVDNRGPQAKADVANLFAIHLVRSPAFRYFHSHVGDQFRRETVPTYAATDELVARFIASEGRRPADGELLAMARRTYDALVADPMSLVTTMGRQHDAMAEMLNRLHLQVIVVAPNVGPGFIIG